MWREVMKWLQARLGRQDFPSETKEEMALRETRVQGASQRANQASLSAEEINQMARLSLLRAQDAVLRRDHDYLR